MVKKRQIRGRSKNRVHYKNSTVQKDNPLRFNAILMSAIAIFVIIFIYFLFFQPYLNPVKITGYSITGKAIQSTDIALNLTLDNPLSPGDVSGASHITGGKSGSAYFFDGVNDYINLTGYPTPLSGNITISAWISPKTLANTENIIFTSGYNYASKQGINLAVAGQKLNFTIGNGTSLLNIVSDINLSPDTWYHIVAVRNSTHVSLFVNKNRQTQTFPLAGLISYSSAITRLGDSAFAFNGTIDEVKILNRALTDTDVAEEYNSYNPPANPPSFFCKDSDVNAFGGQNNFMNYYIKGFVNSSINGVTYVISEDSCTPNNVSVIEYFCNVSGLGQSKNYTCPTRCENGACTGAEVCRDSDGMNYSIQGSINYSIDGINLTYYDYCSPENERSLVEFFCSGNKSNYSFYYCPVNYSCFEGRCNNTAVTRDVITPPPAPVCTDGNFTCQGTLYVLCQNGQWLPGVLLLGQCGYNPDGEPHIIDQPPTEEYTPEKPSGIWMILLIILIIAVVIAVAVIIFIFIKKKQEFNNKTRTSTSPQLIKPSPPSSPSPYSKTPSVQSPIPSSILPAPSTTQKTTTATTTTTSISSASNLKKRQM